MSIVPKIRNKPPKMDGGEWVEWSFVPPPFVVDKVKIWRKGWSDARDVSHDQIPPTMNVNGLMWFCTDMGWLNVKRDLMKMQLAQSRNPYQRRYGFLGGSLFGPW